MGAAGGDVGVAVGNGVAVGSDPHASKNIKAADTTHNEATRLPMRSTCTPPVTTKNMNEWPRLCAGRVETHAHGNDGTLDVLGGDVKRIRHDAAHRMRNTLVRRWTRGGRGSAEDFAREWRIATEAAEDAGHDPSTLLNCKTIPSPLMGEG